MRTHIIWVTALAVWMVGCHAVEPGLTSTPADTATPVPTSTPLVFPAIWTPEPTAVPLPVLDPKVEITYFDLGRADNTLLQDLIIFTSSTERPFNALKIGLAFGKDEDSIRYLQMWAIAPDGQRAGRLSHGNSGSAIYVPTDPAGNPITIGYGISLNNDHLRTARLPGECYGEFSDAERQLGEFLPCSDFAFSPTGRHLALYFGPELCTRGIIVSDTETGEKLYRSRIGAGHDFEFLGTDKVLIYEGHCEGGSVRVLDLPSKALKDLGGQGAEFWNAQRTAFGTDYAPYDGMGGTVWGYNVETDFVFLPQLEFNQVDDHILWVPDGSHLLYQHRPLLRSETSYTFAGARQIIIVDAMSGEQQILMGDPNYDFDLCEGPNSRCDKWFGDWVQVRRFPFQPQSVEFSYDMFSNPIATCRLYGTGCLDPAELFALNWRTGELIPWDQAPLPTVTPTPAPTATPIPGPDLTGAPVYAEPSGAYAFYVGNDGHSLWMVPANGEPQLWVVEGENFIYIP